MALVCRIYTHNNLSMVTFFKHNKLFQIYVFLSVNTFLGIQTSFYETQNLNIL